MSDIKKVHDQLIEGTPSERWDALKTYVKHGKMGEVAQSLVARIIDNRADQTGEDKGKLMSELSVIDTEARKGRMAAKEKAKKVYDERVMELVNNEKFVAKYSVAECPRCHSELDQVVSKKHSECEKCGANLYQRVLERVYTEASRIAEKESMPVEDVASVKTYTVKDADVADKVLEFSMYSEVPYEKAYIAYLQMDTEPSKVDTEIQFRYHKWKNPEMSDAEALRKLR